ncbi:MAG: alpha/beta fold hydrolase [Neisseriales bacterium]|nr:MAG: alpha/beta fold hydrolase [Neisseriales bacterium]
MNSVTTLVIGGFVLSAKPLEFITSQLKNYHYIDVNQLLPEFTLQSQAQIIISQHVCDKQKVQIIAYSCGGLLALTLLQLAPDNIHKLVMLNSTPCFMAQENWQGISNANLQRLRQRLNKQTLAEFTNYFTALAAHPESIDQKDARQWQNLEANRDTLIIWLELIEQTDLRPLAEKFAARIVWINSATDSLIPNPAQNINHQTIDNSTHLRMNPNYLQYIFEVISHE